MNRRNYPNYESPNATNNDRDLNMEVTFNMNGRYRDDCFTISRRFDDFHHRFVNRQDNDGQAWRGFRLNMREFSRALTTGSGQTPRMRTVGTQTDSNANSNNVNNNNTNNN